MAEAAGLQSARHLWTLTEDPEAGLGLSCTKDGLFLGATPLLDRAGGGFIVRTQDDLERLLASGYGVDVALDRAMPGLKAVASALNANDLCRARIAAVHLRISPLPGELARLDMQLEDVSLTLERLGKTTAAGNWDPANHPRAGTAPNPGWFAPVSSTGNGTTGLPASPSGNDDLVRLPPDDHRHIDELADFVEWIANARPEDERAIRSEIKRLYSDVGDHQGASGLHAALSQALEPGVDKEARQQILDWVEHYARADPAEVAQIGRDLTTGALLSLPGAAATIAPRAEKSVWELGWAARGTRIEEALDANLREFDVIDDFRDGIATSIKSVDLRTPTYQDTRRLFGRLSRLVDDVANFNGDQVGEVVIEASDITGRTLRVVVPKTTVTPAQRAAIGAAADYAKSRGVFLWIDPF